MQNCVDTSPSSPKYLEPSIQLLHPGVHPFKAKEEDHNKLSIWRLRQAFYFVKERLDFLFKIKHGEGGMGRNYPKRKKLVFYSFREKGFQNVILESAKQSQRNRGLRACCSHTKGGIWKHLLVFMKINARTNVIPSVQIFCRKKTPQ